MGSTNNVYNTVHAVIKDGVPFYCAVTIKDGVRHVHTSLDASYLRKIMFDRYHVLCAISDAKAVKINSAIGTK
jgi:hypothetical protein